MSGRLLSKIGSRCTKPWIFFVSGGQVFLSSFSRSFDESLSRRLVSGCQEPRTAQCSARVSRSVQPRGRWARSGKNISGCQLSAGVGGVAPRAGAVSAGAIDLAEREHFACDTVLAGCAGRHGEEQRAPGGWRAIRLLPGALRQVRKFDRRVSENLCDLSSSLVPHTRLFSLHPSSMSQIRLCRTVWVP